MKKYFKRNVKRLLVIFIEAGLLLSVLFSWGIISTVRSNMPKFVPFSAMTKTVTAYNRTSVAFKLDVDRMAEPLATTIEKAKAIESEEIEKWLGVAESLGRRIAANHFTYSNSNVRSTYAAALSQARHVNCALYVSWAMQEYGILPYGKTIWLDSSIHGNGASYLKSSDKVTISYPNRLTTSVDLQPGDICGFQIGPSNRHTMIYGGKDSSGRMVWYSAGPGTVRRGQLCRVPGTLYERNKLKVLIRPNYLELAPMDEATEKIVAQIGSL
ncbi:MAG: hypothetical protein IJH77_03520 [Mogibacterium sp.]|nr:hypothetical protein [Mogibacterium sp.]